MDKNLIELIIDKVETLTGITPCVKGGSQKSPITYTYYKSNRYAYRLEIDLLGNNLLGLTSLQYTIVEGLTSLGDSNELPAHIVQNGGGTLQEGNQITLICYFDVIDYHRGGQFNV